MAAESSHSYRVYCFSGNLMCLHRTPVSGPGTMGVYSDKVHITVRALQDWPILLWSILIALASCGVLLVLANWDVARYGLVAGLLVGAALFGWLYPRKLRVFEIEDLDGNLDMREAPGTYFFRVLPRKWIALSAEEWDDRKRIEADLRRLLEEKQP